MNEEKDIRWIQRFRNFRSALHRLGKAVEIVTEQINEDEEVDDLLKEGLIQRFEYTHELAWKVMKDYAEYQGYTDIRVRAMLFVRHSIWDWLLIKAGWTR